MIRTAEFKKRRNAKFRARKKRRITPEEQAHMDAVRELGCIACDIDGAWSPTPEIHHVKRRPDGQKYGYGQKAPHYRVLPLCEGHHRGMWDTTKQAFHKNPDAFEARYGNENELLALIDAKLGKPSNVVLAAWVKCPCCDNYLCNIHGGHAHDCACPDLECFEWATGLDPYTQGGHLTPDELEGLVAGA